MYFVRLHTGCYIDVEGCIHRCTISVKAPGGQQEHTIETNRPGTLTAWNVTKGQTVYSGSVIATMHSSQPNSVAQPSCVGARGSPSPPNGGKSNCPKGEFTFDHFRCCCSRHAKLTHPAGMACQRVPDAGFSPGGICTFDWGYIHACNVWGWGGNDEGSLLSAVSSGFVSADIQCAGKQPNTTGPPAGLLSCNKSTGCSAGVCDKCCNNLIQGPACKECVDQQCNNCRCVTTTAAARLCILIGHAS